MLFLDYGRISDVLLFVLIILVLVIDWYSDLILIFFLQLMKVTDKFTKETSKSVVSKEYSKLIIV